MRERSRVEDTIYAMQKAGAGSLQVTRSDCKEIYGDIYLFLFSTYPSAERNPTSVCFAWITENKLLKTN